MLVNYNYFIGVMLLLSRFFCPYTVSICDSIILPVLNVLRTIIKLHHSLRNFCIIYYFILCIVHGIDRLWEWRTLFLLAWHFAGTCVVFHINLLTTNKLFVHLVYKPKLILLLLLCLYIKKYIFTLIKVQYFLLVII